MHPIWQRKLLRKNALAGDVSVCWHWVPPYRSGCQCHNISSVLVLSPFSSFISPLALCKTDLIFVCLKHLDISVLILTDLGFSSFFQCHEKLRMLQCSISFFLCLFGSFSVDWNQPKNEAGCEYVLVSVSFTFAISFYTSLYVVESWPDNWGYSLEIRKKSVQVLCFEEFLGFVQLCWCFLSFFFRSSFVARVLWDSDCSFRGTVTGFREPADCSDFSSSVAVFVRKDLIWNLSPQASQVSWSKFVLQRLIVGICSCLPSRWGSKGNHKVIQLW